MHSYILTLIEAAPVYLLHFHVALHLTAYRAAGYGFALPWSELYLIIMAKTTYENYVPMSKGFKEVNLADSHKWLQCPIYDILWLKPQTSKVLKYMLNF